MGGRVFAAKDSTEHRELGSEVPFGALVQRRAKAHDLGLHHVEIHEHLPSLARRDTVRETDDGLGELESVPCGFLGRLVQVVRKCSGAGWAGGHPGMAFE